jgi:S-adenosylmethionine-diacylgycerolhomoserine-N-methlytransferase
MLETAQVKADAAGLNNLLLETALADKFTSDGTFGLSEKFDKIFFSYSISMIPPWRESIENALANLKPGGQLFIVDFYDQRDLPSPFRRFLKWWLAKFHVKFWPDLMPYLESLKSTAHVRNNSLFRRYSFIASIRPR